MIKCMGSPRVKKCFKCEKLARTPEEEDSMAWVDWKTVGTECPHYRHKVGFKNGQK